LAALRLQAGQFLPQMTHCTRCRADAVGCLSESLPTKAIDLMRHYANGPLNPSEDRPYYAAATMEGVLVNVHLGQARDLNIYSYDEDQGLKLVETRTTPPVGGGEDRWEKLADLLNDCRAILVADAGPKPTQLMEACGLKVVRTESMIEQAILDIHRNRSVTPPARSFVCGTGCGGNARGCG
jgi:nitrogen fixation protein NifB